MKAGSSKPKNFRSKETDTWHTKKQAVHPVTDATQLVVIPGNIIMRQRGTKMWPGDGVGMGKDHTIFAKVEGNVQFHKGLKGRTFISVLPVAEAAE